MKQELGWFFPDGEKHLPDWMRQARQIRDGRHCYQLSKYIAAMKFVKGSQVAIDVGGHIGQWSWNMAKDFTYVAAFEPVPTYAECFRANLKGADNVQLYPFALGDHAGRVSLKCGTPGSHGDTFVVPREQANAATDVAMKTFDSLKPFDQIDFMKIDCEGFEVFVLRGAEQSIRRCKPCIIVEQKPGMAKKYGLGETDAVALLKSWGAKQRGVLSGDYILSWD